MPFPDTVCTRHDEILKRILLYTPTSFHLMMNRRGSYELSNAWRASHDLCERRSDVQGASSRDTFMALDWLVAFAAVHRKVKRSIAAPKTNLACHCIQCFHSKIYVILIYPARFSSKACPLYPNWNKSSGHDLAESSLLRQQVTFTPFASWGWSINQTYHSG